MSEAPYERLRASRSGVWIHRILQISGDFLLMGTARIANHRAPNQKFNHYMGGTPKIVGENPPNHPFL